MEEYRAQTPGNDRAGRALLLSLPLFSLSLSLGYKHCIAACFTAGPRFGLKFLDRRDGGPWENWRVRATRQKIT